MNPIVLGLTVAIVGPITVLALRALWRNTIGRTLKAVENVERLMENGIRTDLAAMKEAMWLHLEGRNDQAKRALTGRLDNGGKA